MAPIVQIDHLVKHYYERGGLMGRICSTVHALRGVSLQVERGETVGVVGESGCGKSTLGKAILRLLDPTSGSIRFDGQEIAQASHRQLMPLRRQMQFIFQDPQSALNPRMTVGQAIREAVRFHRVVPRRDVPSYVDALLATVGMHADARDRYPHEFSGGQRQRINIARALAVRPKFLVADEPVSALDVSVQAQVLNLLMDLKENLSLTLLFISHDLRVVEHFCDRLVVMYLGHIVETMPCDDVARRARHPYTEALLGANPVTDPDARRPMTVLEGDVPSPRDPPQGCAFCGRCPIAEPRCEEETPPLVRLDGQHQVACWAVE